MSVAVGTQLADRYELLSRIGDGGMGSVWRAADTVLDRPVAVKVVATQLTEDPEFTQRFRREARVAARLDHPHITSVFDYGEVTQDGQPVQYLVMELLTGETLADRLRTGPLDRHAAVAMGVEVADALAEAHRHGIVHRDITPGNIMLTRAGAKVLDFGISTIAGDATMTAVGRTLGTPAYLAPERVAGQRATPAVDVYALGAVLVHAITGRTPYEGSWSDQAHAHVHEPPPVLTDVPDALARLLHACLAKDPTDRPASDTLAGSLRALAGTVVRRGTSPATQVLPIQHNAAPQTRVLPAYVSYAEADDQRRGRAGPVRFLAWLTLIAAVVLAVIAAANVLSDDPAASTPPAATQSATSPPAASPSENSPQGQSDLAAAVEDISEIGAAALAAGDLTRLVARDIDNSLTKAINQARREDYRDAQRTLKNLDDRLENRADDGALDEAVYDEIHQRLAILADALDEAADNAD